MTAWRAAAARTELGDVMQPRRDKKVIGILGGMGPQAGHELHRLLIEEASRRLWCS